MCQEEAIQTAFDSNIVVFDKDAPIGQFTVRLTTLVDEVMQSQYGHSVQSIYVPIPKSQLDMYEDNNIELHSCMEFQQDAKYGQLLSDGKRAGDDICWGLAVNSDETCFILISF